MTMMLTPEAPEPHNSDCGCDECAVKRCILDTACSCGCDEGEDEVLDAMLNHEALSQDGGYPNQGFLVDPNQIVLPL